MRLRSSTSSPSPSQVLAQQDSLTTIIPSDLLLVKARPRMSSAPCMVLMSKMHKCYFLTNDTTSSSLEPSIYHLFDLKKAFPMSFLRWLASQSSQLFIISKRSCRAWIRNKSSLFTQCRVTICFVTALAGWAHRLHCSQRTFVYRISWTNWNWSESGMLSLSHTELLLAGYILNWKYWLVIG